MYKIGVFIGNIDELYQKEVWKGIIDEAETKRAKIICFPGLRVDYKENFEYQANIVYRFAGKQNIDGLIIMSNTIFSNLKKREILKFCMNYKSFPVVNFGFTIPGITTIKIDSNNGIRELVGHLVTEHHYKKFAFIKGPDNHPEAENRFKVFCDALLNFDINIDERLITTGDFLKESGYRAVKTLIDDRKKDFDVIVSANDSMAIGAIESLQNRNITVPDDIAVVGYDDIEECLSSSPRLTTVHQPIYEKGREAVSILYEIIENGNIKKNKTIPSSLIIRQSCGCFSNLNNISMNIALKKDSFYEKFLEQKKTILEECKVYSGQIRNLSKYKEEEAQIVELFDAYYKNIKKIESNNFIMRLEKILKKLLYIGIDVNFWHNFISALRKHTLKFSIERNDLLKAECIWEQARIIIDERYNLTENLKKVSKDKFIKTLWEIGNSISSAFNMEKLIDEIISCLKKFEIKQCFFSIYENNGKNEYPKWSRLLLAIVNGEKMNIGKNEIRFRSECLIPKKFFSINTHYPLIIKPLYFHGEQLGFIIFEMKPLDPLIYDFLRQQISSALKGSRLMNDVEQHARILEKEVNERTIDLTDSNIQLKEEIYQRKNIEKALKESEKNLRAIVEAVPIQLLIVNLSDGSILYSNKSSNSAYGIDAHKTGKMKISDLCVDYRQIDEIMTHLKENKNISDVELPVYTSDKSVIWVIASFKTLMFHGQKAFISGFYDITKRKQLEREILDISDREQIRIGQDLHDDLCQRLAGISAMITALENNLKHDRPEDSKKAELISLFLNESIVQTKKLARGLYPVSLDNNGLIHSIEELTNKIKLQFGICCDFYYNKNLFIIDKSISLHLYRITQEAVYNAVKHANPGQISIRLISNKDSITLSIEDNGRGFNFNMNESNGMGLKIMNYRTNMVGGKIIVKSSNNKGTIITCSVKK